MPEYQTTVKKNEDGETRLKPIITNGVVYWPDPSGVVTLPGEVPENEEVTLITKRSQNEKNKVTTSKALTLKQLQEIGKKLGIANVKNYKKNEILKMIEEVQNKQLESPDENENQNGSNASVTTE